MAGRTDSGRWYQRKVVQEQNVLASVLVLTPGTARVIPLFDPIELDGRGVESMD